MSDGKNIVMSPEQFAQLIAAVSQKATTTTMAMSPEETRIRERHAAADAEGDKLRLRKWKATRTATTTYGEFTTSCTLAIQFGERGPTEGRVVHLLDRDESAALQAIYEAMLPTIESALFEARRAGDAAREQELKQRVMKPSGLGHGSPGAKHVCCIEVSMPTMREVVSKWVKVDENGKVIGLPGNWTIGQESTEETVHVRHDSPEWAAAKNRSEADAEAHRKANLLSPQERKEREERAAAAYAGVVR